MDLALLAARLLLASVFGIAGLAKIADCTGSRQALVGFGIPTKLATPLSVLLPLAEIAIAIALLPVTTAWWGAVGATALLLLFVGGIGYNLARGRTPDCHCFGQLHSAPAGWPTLARNMLLTAVAGFVVWQGATGAGASAISWLALLTTAQIVGLIAAIGLGGILALQGWLMLHLLRQNGRLLLRIEALEAHLTLEAPAVAPTPTQAAAGLPVGSPAPTFQLTGLYGETLTLDALRASTKPVLLLFSDPSCGPCTALLPDIARWQREHAAALTIAPISRGTVEANRAKSAEHGLTHVLLQEDREVAQSYQAYGTPSAVLINPDGTIGSSLALGAEAIRALVARTTGTPAPAQPTVPAPPPVQPTAAAPTQAGGCGCGKHNGNGHGTDAAAPIAAKIGNRAPKLALPDLSGKIVNLAQFRGHETLVLFWNPGCGFCTRMLDDLKAWEANRPKSAPRLLVVSTGSVEANQAMDLKSPVVLDEGFTIGRAFGASGTPSAVLVDAKGNIASEVTVGAPAVLKLARAGQDQAQPVQLN